MWQISLDINVPIPHQEVFIIVLLLAFTLSPCLPLSSALLKEWFALLCIPQFGLCEGVSFFPIAILSTRFLYFLVLSFSCVVSFPFTRAK